ncbi:hypothetical protein IEQ34_023055 [Dendrobium chrysotoxum]|uniref:Late embryogenesis abundant protein LEA-2 subgroup domain-containing protein n=1 Tax=Dendrobium chrysotoxum TaxID=161865 RepID=A0AAV7G0R7_DENCH|nr:hypothetical protein IEQ34_023055 [Dendrobium chrysotoxum]
MHRQSDSDLTSLAASSPPRSPRRPVYYVMSPSNLDNEKLSIFGLSPAGSPVHQHYNQHPTHHRYASSPIHHSRESSTTRFSASLRNGYWRKVPQEIHGGDQEDVEKEEEEEERWGFRFYVVMFVVGFFLLFSLFSIILWGASKAYEPKITIKSLVFERYNIQAGMDFTGVPTKMISINSTVKMRFKNPATFFGVHVSSTPLQLYYYDLLIASGHMKEFYASRKNERLVTTVMLGKEVPVYGGGATLTSHNNGEPSAVVPFKLTFVVRASANVLGQLVRSKFYRAVRCSVYLHESRLGRPVDLRRACEYD